MANPDRARHDVNLNPTLVAVSNADGETPVSLWADPNTHTLVTTAGGGGGSGDGAILDGVNATIKATVFSLASSKPLATQIVDATGAAITSFGGGTQYTNGAAVASPIGGVALGYDGANVRAMAADTSGNGIVVGNVASGVTDSSNPVKIGGRYNSTVPTFTDGQRGDLQLNARGSVAIELRNGGNPAQFQATNADAITTHSLVTAVETAAVGLVYNGTTFDRMRSGPTTGSVLVSAPTATGASVPANAFYMGVNNGTTLNGLVSLPAIADAAAGSGAMAVGTLMYNGTNWDRTRGDIANGLDVDVTRIIPGTTSTSLGKAEDAAHVSGDTGVMSLGVANEANVNLSGTDGDYTPIATQRDGTLHVMQKTTSATTSSVAGSATSVTLLSANSLRKGGSIYNDSTAVLYLKYGTTASTTSFKVLLAAGAYFEISAGYDGRIDGIWSAASGFARISEET